MNIGKTLKYFRQLHNFTQSELAYKAGLNEKYYGQLERNESSPTINSLEKICTALDIGIDTFFNHHLH